MGLAARRGGAQLPAHPTYFVFIKNVKNKGGKFGWVAKGEELLVDLLEPGSIQLAAGAVLDEALVPGKERKKGGSCL